MKTVDKIAYRTQNGTMFQGKAEDILSSRFFEKYYGKIQLIFTSPPFPLNRKKKYGNFQGDEYMNWLAEFAPIFKKMLKKNGSIVIEMGNAWESGKPVMSTLAIRSLLAFIDSGALYLCQQFICYNPARLPSPAQWVNIDRIRVKDSYTHLWWMSATPRPKADNRRVLKEYSNAMRDLLKRGKYNSGLRPSEHNIGSTSFLKEHKGAIPSNVLTFANTGSNDTYQKFCREKGLHPHPARMHPGVAEFFINFLTTGNDLVLDPFAGSNTTGSVAEKLKRQWISIEPSEEYVLGSFGRFNIKL